MGGRCLKILVLVTLIPVALRASSFLLGGHGGAPATSWHVSRRRPAAAAAVTSSSVSAGSLRKVYHQVTRQRRRRTESVGAADDTGEPRRVEVDGGDWFEDDKRLAPTGSNPLHNRRR